MTLLTRNRGPLIALLLVAALIVYMLNRYGGPDTASGLISGLTLGAVFFLLASGLSLIFGLMDVLNFAHGLFFMLGAYVGYTMYENPRLLLNTLPFALVLWGAVALGSQLGRRFPMGTRPTGTDRAITIGLTGVATAIIVAGVWGFSLLSLASSESSAGGKVPTDVAQEGLGQYFTRLGVLIAGGFVLGLAIGRRAVGLQRNKRAWLGPLVGIVAIGLAFLLAMVRTEGETALLALPLDARFVLALIAGAGAGAAFGALVEWSLIRPLYARPIYQVLLTIGLTFVGTELIKVIWGNSTFNMATPTFFNTPRADGRSCASPDLLSFLSDHCTALSVFGRRVPSYWTFIILLGIVIFIAVAILLKRTRMGMIIRAGVQDSEMVQALGINVRRVFTLVFALGTGLAALGGVAVGPFLGVHPDLGQEFLLFGFIAVVVGGMGSYAGAAAGALLLGFARAFGDLSIRYGIGIPFTDIEWEKPPTFIATASAVLLMAIVLLVRPAGLLGKKD
ncbi:MAG TPA: branched-chain amino acid ABC transporter permease [Chloroflexia bacterium]|nr:branched-chain amino acid ABC transporter permease [Chloroflexia bacterium]